MLYSIRAYSALIISPSVYMLSWTLWYVSEQMCTATESPLGTCLTDITLALEGEESVKAWSVTLKRHQRDDVTSQAAWWLVECSGGVLLYSFFIFLFLYYPLPLFGPAGRSSPVCTTVFAMNMFRESPLCGTWWMRTAENFLHSPLMLSPWPTLTTQCMSIFCILMGFESSPFSSWQVNAHPNKEKLSVHFHKHHPSPGREPSPPRGTIDRQAISRL